MVRICAPLSCVCENGPWYIPGIGTAAESGGGAGYALNESTPVYVCIEAGVDVQNLSPS